MRQSRSHLIAIVLAGLVIGGLWAAVPVTGEAVSSDGGEREPGVSATMLETEPPVEVEIDCNRSRVEFTAPEEHRYDATVAVANLTETTNDVTRSTVGSVEGNETIEFDDEGIVFAFARNQSDDERMVATDVSNCSTETDESNATERPNDADLEIQVDCAENDVRFIAPEGSDYVAKVVAVAVSPTSSSTQSVTRTLEGNATVSVDDETLVAAFASSGELGDDGTVSTIRNCTPYGPERISDAGNETRNG